MITIFDAMAAQSQGFGTVTAHDQSGQSIRVNDAKLIGMVLYVQSAYPYPARWFVPQKWDYVVKNS